jgi:ribosomal protein S18 acetylase RimI-like enzyme
MNVDTHIIESILATDRVWSAYALADLEPEHKDFCIWSVMGRSILLTYMGLDPPALFMYGNAPEIAEMLPDIPEGTYQFSCLPEHLNPIQETIETDNIVEMWRMVYSEHLETIDLNLAPTQRLDANHLEDINALFANHPESPDAFMPSQLNSGMFFGVYEQGRLVAISGTHVCSNHYRLAAIGNVFTDPAYRGKGYASLTTQAVVEALLANGIETIVLNVARSNTPAIKAYQRTGFRPYCGYFEGYGKRIKR